ncbi:hypothetical protein V2J09_020146 [Rumex salicifolius]
MGKWDVHSFLESSKDLYGPENHGAREVPRHVRFSFANPVRCRIIWITLSLEKDKALDERDVCLHARRILVVGSSIKDDEIDLTLNEAFNSKHLKPPKLSRFKIPIEGEKSMDNDLVLEMCLSSSTFLAGFRLDAFSAIQPRVTHSPEYRLPMAKPGTAMYFDFPKELQTERILFKLVGDVSSFTDDPAEQDDPEFNLIPVGLSLCSRINLYYYADSYEISKWATAI